MASPYRIPSGPRLHPSTATNPRSRSTPRKTTWQPRLPFLSSRTDPPQESEESEDSNEAFSRTNATDVEKPWWRIRLFRGMINDVRRRAPFYWSDWRDAWDYRVIPATIYMYFVRLVDFVHFLLQSSTLIAIHRQSMSPYRLLIYQRYHAWNPF